jgi:hypothetical protein
MIVHGFDMYRVYLSTPGDLVRELDACRNAISEVNASDAMPLEILLVSVGLREEGQIVGHRAAVAENVRQCAYFIQVFEDDWGPNNLHRKMFLLGCECRDDPETPMRDVIVCLKNTPHETDPAVLAFRKELEDQSGVHLLRFEKAEDLQARLIETCTNWVQAIAEADGGAKAAQSGSQL